MSTLSKDHSPFFLLSSIRTFDCLIAQLGRAKARLFIQNVMWHEMDAVTFIKAISPLLKQQGFKKANSTWCKDQGESLAVFNVQKSQWGGGIYYINLGTYFRAFGSDAFPTENKCHVQVRLPVDEPSTVVTAAMEWFQVRASLQAATKLAEADSKKGMVFKELRSAAAT